MAAAKMLRTASKCWNRWPGAAVAPPAVPAAAVISKNSLSLPFSAAAFASYYYNCYFCYSICLAALLFSVVLLSEPGLSSVPRFAWFMSLAFALLGLSRPHSFLQNLLLQQKKFLNSVHMPESFSTRFLPRSSLPSASSCSSSSSEYSYAKAYLPGRSGFRWPLF